MGRTGKFRGRCRTHGRGHKAGRGAGKRGGRGLAGINKHRVMTRIKYMPNHWGMHGFNRDPSLRKVSISVNVSQLVEFMNKDNNNSVNLSKLGIDKLLGSGQVRHAINVTVSEASARAIEKIEAAGGSVSVEGSDEWEELEEE